MEQKRQHYFYLDVLRVAAAACVLLLHCVVGVLNNPAYFGSASWWVADVCNSIGRMGVPLFFMISGFLLLDDGRTLSIGHFYRKRLVRILVPFLFWDIVYFIYYRWIDGLPLSIGDFFAELFNQGSAYHLWFLYAMAGLYLLMPFVKRIVDASSRKQVILLLCLILFPVTFRPLLNTLFPIYLYWFEPLMNGYFGFVLLGYVLGKYPPSASRRNMVLCAVVFLAGMGLGTFGNYFASSGQEILLPYNGGYSLNHFLMAGALFLFVQWACANRMASANNMASANRMAGTDVTGHHGPTRRERRERIVSACSGLTFGVYFIHVLILDLALRFPFFETSPVGNMLYLFTVTAVLSSCAALTLSRTGPIKRFFM